MLKEEILEMRDLVSDTVRDLVFVAAKIEQEVIIINMLDREIKLPVKDLWDRRHSAKSFINYLKEKLNEKN